jgi:glycerophosphoryl diester phosphodiesterase
MLRTLIDYCRRALLPVAASLMLVAGCDEVPVEVPNVNPFDLDCPGQTVHFANVDTFLVIGHRGAGNKEVENTIASFQTALNDGANAIELDFCMTSDGEIVVWHDWNPNDPVALLREQGGEMAQKFKPRFPPVNDPLRRPVDELTLEEFRTHYYYTTKNVIDKERVPAEIPTFEDFLKWAAGKPELYYVFFDIKLPKDKEHLGDRMFGKMDSLMQLYKPSFKPVYITPYENIWTVIDRMIEQTGLSFDVDLGAGTVPDDPCTMSSSRFARQRNGGFATTMHPFTWTEAPWSTLKRLLYCDLLARDTPGPDGHPVVEKVVAATVNDVDKMRCLVDFGVDGIMTDDAQTLAWIAKGEKGKIIR